MSKFMVLVAVIAALVAGTALFAANESAGRSTTNDASVVGLVDRGGAPIEHRPRCACSAPAVAKLPVDWMPRPKTA